ncbi:MAG: S-layer homology domain-containing protein, partial [bacterium]
YYELDLFTNFNTPLQRIDYLTQQLSQLDAIQLTSSSPQNITLIQDFILNSLEICEPLQIEVNKNDIYIQQDDFQSILDNYNLIHAQIINIFNLLSVPTNDELTTKLSLLQKGLINPLQDGEPFDAPNLVAYNVIAEKFLEFDKDEISNFSSSSDFYDYLEEKLNLISDLDSDEDNPVESLEDLEINKRDIEEIENYLNTINDNMPIETIETKDNLVSLSQDKIKNLLGEMSGFYDDVLNLIKDYDINLNKEHEHTLNIALMDLNLDDTINFVITSDMVDDFKNHSYIRFIFDELGTNIVLDVQNVVDIFENFNNSQDDDIIITDDIIIAEDILDELSENVLNNNSDSDSDDDDDTLNNISSGLYLDEDIPEDIPEDNNNQQGDDDDGTAEEFKYFQDLQSYQDFEESNTIEFSLKYNKNNVMFNANTPDLALYITTPFYVDDSDKSSNYITNPEDITIIANINGEFLNWGGQVNASNNTIEFLATSAGSYQVQVTETIINDISHLDDQLQHIVKFMVSKEFFSTINDNFYPDGLMTRYDFIASLVKVFFVQDNTLVSKFDDVDTSNPYHNIVAAAENGNITKGYQDNTFRGDILITRETLVSFVGRVLGEQLGYTYPENVDDTLSIFQDFEDISEWAKNDVSLALSHGVIKIDDNFYPQEEITRLEALESVYNLFAMLYVVPNDDVFANIASTFNKPSGFNKDLLMGIGAGVIGMGLLSFIFRKKP